MNSFLDALTAFLKSMPDHQPLEATENIRLKSSVHPPGIDDFPSRGQRRPGPVRILWAARWEHDKNPEDFFRAIRILKAQNARFRLNVIDQSFEEQPDVFAKARCEFLDHIDYWGYQYSRKDYVRALHDSDFAVSTANHEFFGISLVEAVAAGAYPLVPERLSYPEILGLGRIEGARQFFYDGTAADLADKLTELATGINGKNIWPCGISPSTLTGHLKWANLAPRYDQVLAQLSH